jgi:hypothetical protein
MKVRLLWVKNQSNEQAPERAPLVLRLRSNQKEELESSKFDSRTSYSVCADPVKDIFAVVA